MQDSTHIVCISESTHPNDLTQGRSYAIVAHDAGKEQYRILNDRGQHGWYPSSCFAPPHARPPGLSHFKCTGSFIPSDDGSVDVTIVLTTGKRRWCVFMTPRYAARLGPSLISKDGWSFRLQPGTSHVHLISELHETLIATALEHLDRQGGLVDGSLPLTERGH